MCHKKKVLVLDRVGTLALPLSVLDTSCWPLCVPALPFWMCKRGPWLLIRFAAAMTPYKQRMIDLLSAIACERLCLSCALPMISSYLDVFLGNLMHLRFRILEEF